MDIKPPRNWKPQVPQRQRSETPMRPVAQPEQPKKVESPMLTPKTTSSPAHQLPIEVKSKPKKRRWLAYTLLGVAFLIVAAAGAGWWWYNDQLRPVDAKSDQVVRFEVKEGTRFSEISAQLKGRGLIRSTLAFDVYARISGKQNSIKASTCSLKKSESSQQILNKLSAGCHDFKSITFFPGGTIEKPLYKPANATMSQTMYVKYVLQKAGYSDTEIAGALAKTYDSPIFAGKPEGKTLEGYIFGETYYVPVDASAEDVLQETFKQFKTVIDKNDLVNKFKAQGLTLYQGITLASIVQRELNCEDKPTPERKARCYGYQQTVAQVFLKRYHEGMNLGSDVTFIYAADMLGVTPSVDLDSPYNTRRYPGLPPGPIASPGELALKAVANPSNTDYVFFIAGDDGLIYFARTNEEHEANIQNHCQVLCNEPF